MEKKNAARYFPDDVLNADYIYAKKDAWKDASGFHFLATPESIGFAMLNPADSHKKYKQHNNWIFVSADAAGCSYRPAA